MEGMVDDFEAVLRGEIFAMMLEGSKLRRRPSEQSISATNTGSHKHNRRRIGKRHRNYTDTIHVNSGQIDDESDSD